MKKKVLITGSNGLLGQKLLDLYLKREEIELHGCARGENRYPVKNGFQYHDADISDRASISKVIASVKPDTIIHTAAMTNVDACELDPDACKRANVDAVQYICDALNDAKPEAQLVHVSTDFIFDGSHGPVDEDEKPAPLSIYGQSKLDAEIIVQKSGLEHAILRTVLVYGVVSDMSRSNIVLWAKGALEKGTKINVVNDQFRTPTLAEDLAMGCMLAEQKKAHGVYNISGPDFMSILELVTRVAKFWNLDASLINPVDSTTFTQPAKRPPITGFIIDKAINDLGYHPHSFEEGLKLVDRQLKELYV
jgi:dTDP-4-dehydrorhamnose reductase